MEERLEIVLNEIFLKYGFLFDKKSELEDLDLMFLFLILI